MPFCPTLNIFHYCPRLPLWRDISANIWYFHIITKVQTNPMLSKFYRAKKHIVWRSRPKPEGIKTHCLDHLLRMPQISNSGNSGLTAVGRVERRHWHFRKIWQNPDLLPQWNLPSWPHKDQRWSENQIRWICVILRCLCQSWVCVSVTQCQPRELPRIFKRTLWLRHDEWWLWVRPEDGTHYIYIS